MKRDAGFICGLLGTAMVLLLLLSLNTHASSDSVIGSASPPNRAWRLINGDGFGDPSNTSLPALEEFNGFLYAGTSNGLGSQVWRSGDGLTWSNMITSNIGSLQRIGQHVLDFAVLNNNLYAATYFSPGFGSEMWRSSNGIDWTRVITLNGIGNGDNQVFESMQVFSNSLYVKVSDPDLSYAALWQTADGLSWQKATPDGNVETMTTFGDSLYASTSGGLNGVALWRTDGLTWTVVMTGGFGTYSNTHIHSLAVFDGSLWALVENSSVGVEIWRATNGMDWTQTVSGQIGGPGSFIYYRPALFAFNGHLFLFIRKWGSGGEVWRSVDGTHWEQVGFGGWGNPSNWGPNGANSIVTFHGQMFVGTGGVLTSGSQLWLYLPNTLYLPLVGRN